MSDDCPTCRRVREVFSYVTCDLCIARGIATLERELADAIRIAKDRDADRARIADMLKAQETFQENVLRQMDADRAAIRDAKGIGEWISPKTWREKHADAIARATQEPLAKELGKMGSSGHLTSTNEGNIEND